MKPLIATLLLQVTALQKEHPGVVLPTRALVTGHILPSPDGDVLAYLNLRYATPSSRFGEPVPYYYASGEVVDGSVMNQPCIQRHDGEIIGEEDCLSLAVFTPPVRSSTPRPVLVFIHGGFLVDGKIKDYVGRLNYMALKSDAVVVAIQYRLNILGFMQPFLETPANRGLRDQIEALRWVRTNIASFGGDPQQVTIWGQSAGGRSVVALYQSPMAKGLFQRAIAMSPGYVPAMFQVDLATVVGSMSKRCLEITGCLDLQCLEQIDMKHLVKSCIFYLSPEEFVVTPKEFFSGYDGAVLMRPVRDALCKDAEVASGHVPIILGAMAHEWRAFAHGIPASGFLSRFYGDSLPAWSEAKRSCLQDYTMKLFANAPCPADVGICKTIDADLVQAATQVYSLGVGFGTGQGSGARYRYLMDTDPAGNWCGACHSQDLTLLLDHSNKEYPAERARFRETFASYLSSFVRTGVPTAPVGSAVWDGLTDRHQGTAFMSFNFSHPTEMSSSVYFSLAGNDEMMEILCGEPMAATCAAI